MFGEIPPSQINAAVPFIKYSCNTVRPTSRPRIFFPSFPLVFFLPPPLRIFSSLFCSLLVVFTSLTADRSQRRDSTPNIHLSSCLSALPLTTAPVELPAIYAVTCLLPLPQTLSVRYRECSLCRNTKKSPLKQKCLHLRR